MKIISTASQEWQRLCGRQLSRKRLTDGQYDQCDLTFRELTMVEESMVKSLCAIYHGRIMYPSQREDDKKPATMSA